MSELDGEGGAAAFLAVDGDAAAVLEDNLSAEAEADAGAAGLGGEERNEGLFEYVGRHAAAAVSIPVSLVGLHQLVTRYYTIHATIAWWIPLVSIAIVLLLCALTLWQQVWKATRIKPYEVLKEN